MQDLNLGLDKIAEEQAAIDQAKYSDSNNPAGTSSMFASEEEDESEYITSDANES